VTPSSNTEKRDLLIAWTRQCFQAAGLEATEREARDYAAIAAEAIVDDGFAVFAEGASLPHGSGSKTVAGGHPVPGFIAYLRSSAPADAAGKLDVFDEIFEKFVEYTAVVEAAHGPGGNAAYNRSENAANEIFDQFFAERTEATVTQLHEGFGDASTQPIDMSKVTAGRAGTAGGCVVMAVGMIGFVAGALLRATARAPRG
jgi:hypothetical protein